MSAKPSRADLTIGLLTCLRDGEKNTQDLASYVNTSTQNAANAMRQLVSLRRAIKTYGGGARTDPSRYIITDLGREYLDDPHAGRKPWPKDELEFIRAKWSSMSILEIAKKLGRGEKAVGRQAKNMGLPARKPTSPWDDPAMVDLLRKCISEGLTPAQSAPIIGLTRASISSKAASLGLRFALPQRVVIRTDKTPRAPTPRLAAPPQMHVVPPTAKPWIEREFGECAFPVCGEGADTFSCCGPVVRGAYCAGHHALMRVAPSPRKASTEPSIIRRRA